MHVVMYSRPGCPQCTMLKNILDQLKINYDVIQDVDILLEKGIMHIPCLEIDGQLKNFGEALAWTKECAK